MKVLALITALLLASPASATVMSIGYEQPLLGPGITPVLNVANPANGFISANFVVGNFTVTTTFHAGSTTDLTGTVSVAVNDPNIGGWASFYMTLSDITAPIGPVTFKHTMTINMPSLSWADRTTYADDAAQADGGNGVFSLTTYLQPPLIYNHDGTETFFSPYNVPPGLYSETLFFSVQSTPVAVPDPIVGAGLPGLLMLGLLLWRRRRGQTQTHLAQDPLRLTDRPGWPRPL